MELGPHRFPWMEEEAARAMRRTMPARIPMLAAEQRRTESDGAALFYAMSGAFLSLFAFALWYCPRHL